MTALNFIASSELEQYLVLIDLIVLVARNKQQDNKS